MWSCRFSLLLWRRIYTLGEIRIPVLEWLSQAITFSEDFQLLSSAIANQGFVLYLGEEKFLLTLVYQPMCENSTFEKERDRRLELYKLEYEQAAQRYENIYKATWQIFSYMSVLAAGILTFAARAGTLPLEVITFFALLPLVFWFTATFVPMNTYGDQTLFRLCEIENDINNKFFNENDATKLKHYQKFQKRRDPSKQNEKLQKQKEQSEQLKEPFSKPLWRVRHVVWIFGITVSVFWFISIIFCVHTLVSHYRSPSLESDLRKSSLELSFIENQAPTSQFYKYRNTSEAFSRRIVGN